MPERHTPTIDQEPSKELSFERWLETEFKEQYDSQVRTLDRLGLLELLPEAGEKGLRGIDGKEYPLPSKEVIITELKKNQEKIKPKFKQDFTQIQLTPFGVPLERLTTLLQERILAHHKAGQLFAAKDNPADPDVPLELDTNQPLFTWDGHLDQNAPQGQRGADVTGKCVYHPTSFDQKNHGGQTKQEILDDQTKNKSPFPGWEVKLLEKNLNIPREGKGKTVGGRKQLETNKTPEQYLKILQTDPQYQHEQGLTNEDWLTQFLIHLEKTNQVIDDYQGKGSACFLAGSFNPASRRLGNGSWLRDARRAYLGWSDPDVQYSYYGFRPAVEL